MTDQLAPLQRATPRSLDTSSHLTLAPDAPVRTVRLTRASEITPKATRWLWHHRVPLGELSLLAGREGIGKSTVAYALVADVTRGRLPGHHQGVPASVAVAATEDSWAHTIVPRLMAADADLDRVFRLEVETANGQGSVLTLPRDLEGTEEVLREQNAALLLLDPLMSRLAAGLDTHKDAEVRQALEPLVQIGQRTGTSIVGLIHVSKGGSKDPLTSIMGSRAFAAVARAVNYVLADPDEDGTRLLGLAKSNLGPTDVDTLTFRIEPTTVCETEDGPVVTGRVVWGADRNESVADIYEAADQYGRGDSSTSEVDRWLRGFLTDRGGAAQYAEVLAAAKADGLAESTLKRSRKRLGVTTERKGFGNGSWWSYDTARDSRSPAQSHSGRPRARGES